MILDNPRPVNLDNAVGRDIFRAFMNLSTGSFTTVDNVSGEILHHIGKCNKMIGAESDFCRLSSDAVRASDDGVIDAVNIAADNFDCALRPYGVFSHSIFLSDGEVPTPSVTGAGLASSVPREGGAQ